MLSRSFVTEKLNTYQHHLTYVIQTVNVSAAGTALQIWNVLVREACATRDLIVLGVLSVPLVKAIALPATASVVPLW